MDTPLVDNSIVVCLLKYYIYSRNDDMNRSKSTHETHIPWGYVNRLLLITDSQCRKSIQLLWVFTLNCIKKQDKDPTYKDEKMNTINYKIHSKNTWHDIRYVLSRIIRIAHRKTKDEEMGRGWINKHLQDK